MNSASRATTEKNKERSAPSKGPEQPAAAKSPAPGDTAALLQRLQRTAGNSAVNTLLRQYAVQRASTSSSSPSAQSPAVYGPPRDGQEPEQAGPLQAGPLQAGPLQAGPLQAGPLQAAPEVGLEGDPLSAGLSSRISSKRGLLLTYGELNTLGDYMANPRAIDTADRACGPSASRRSFRRCTIACLVRAIWAMCRVTRAGQRKMLASLDLPLPRRPMAACRVAPAGLATRG